MKNTKRFRHGFLVACFSVLVLGAIPPAHGLVYNLADGNSSVSIDVDSQHGMFDWVIDGVNLAPVVDNGDADYRQWFWYRVGSNPEASVDTLDRGFTLASNNNQDPNNNVLNVNYTNSLLRIEITLSLAGGTAGSGTSDIAEQIKIVNTSGSPLSVSFFQYGDFKLCNFTNETVTFPNANAILEQGSVGNVMETVITPVATHREALVFANTINKLNDGVADNLIDNAGSNGDVTWANQWDFTLTSTGIGSSVQISKDKLATIPEPSTVLLVVGGLLGLFFGSRRRH